VWGCRTTKKWRDEGNPNPRLQGSKCLLSVRGERHLPNKPKQIKYIIFYPIYSSNYDMRETGYMGEQAFYRTSKIPPGLDQCSGDSWRLLEMAGDSWRNADKSNPGGVDFGWGVPCPLSRD